MSSTMDRRRRIEHWIVIVASVACTAWYAKGQLLFTLYFGYQLARFWFPQWLPAVSGSVGWQLWG